MESSMFQRAGETLRSRRDNRLSRALLLFLAVLVAGATVALLTQPGQAKTYTKKVLDCPIKVHKHTKDCYDEDDNLICGYADYVVHVHNDDCYDEKGELVCQLPEIPEHKHTDKCFEEEKVLICEQEESEGHEHTEKCYEKRKGELICDKEEDESHEHTDECYEWTEELTCDKEESEGHKHTEKCYEVRKVPVCGELELHTHTKDCYDKDGNLICGQLELLEHVHGPECFREVELTEEEVAALNEQEDEAAASDGSAQDASAPAEGQDVSAPAEDQDASSPAEGQDASAPADGSTAPAETSADQPAEGGEAASEQQGESPAPEQADGQSAGSVTQPDAPKEQKAQSRQETAAQSTAQQPVSDEKTFTQVYRDKKLEVTAEYTAEAQIPENAKLQVKDCSDDQIRRMQGGEEAHEGSVYFDIGFYVDGKEVEPKAPVTMHIRFLNHQFENDDEMVIRHYGRGGVEEIDPQVKKNPTGDTEAVFDADSFSPYEAAVRKAPAGGTLTVGNELTDEVIDRMFSRSFAVNPGIPQKRPSETELATVENAKVGKRNASSASMLWKDAQYNAETDSVDIKLSYFHRQGTPMEFIIVIDETCTMGSWVTSTVNENNSYSVKATQYNWARAAALKATKQLLAVNGPDGYDNRVTFITMHHCQADYVGTYNNYDAALAGLNAQSSVGGGTDHPETIEMVIDRARQARQDNYTPVVVYLSDFHCNFDCVKDYALDELNSLARVYGVLIFDSFTSAREARMRRLSPEGNIYYGATSSDPCRLFDAFPDIIDDVIGRIPRGYQVDDELYGPLKSVAATKLNYSGPGSSSYDGSDVHWGLYDTSEDKKLETGKLYTKTISIPLNQVNWDGVYSGSMPSNETCQVLADGSRENSVESPITKMPVKVQVLSTVDNRPVQGVQFELKRQMAGALGDVVWTGVSDGNGMVAIPYDAEDRNGAAFAPGDKYVLVEKKETQSDGQLPVTQVDYSSWTLETSENYKISSSIATSITNVKTPLEMTATNGHFVVWEQGEVEAPLTPVVLNKTWKNTPEGKQQTIHFTVYGVKADGSEHAVPAYTRNSRNSELVTTLSESDTYTSSQNVTTKWSKRVFVPAQSGDGENFTSYKMVEDGLIEHSDGSWAEPEMVYMPGGTKVETLLYSHSSAEYAQKTNQKFTKLLFYVDTGRKCKNFYGLRYFEICMDYADSNGNGACSYRILEDLGASYNLYDMVNERFAYVYNLVFPGKYKSSSLYEIKSVKVFDKDMNQIQMDIYNASFESQKQYEYAAQVYSPYNAHFCFETIYYYQSNVITDDPTYQLTNTFTPYKALTFSSTFQDSSDDKDSTAFIKSVTYTVKKGDEVWGTYTAPVRQMWGTDGNPVYQTEVQSVLVPPGSYTVTQSSYQLVYGTGDDQTTLNVAAENGTFTAYDVNEASRTISDGETAQFINTRKSYNVKVNTVWKPELTTNDSFHQYYNDQQNRFIPYKLSYNRLTQNGPEPLEATGQVEQRAQYYPVAIPAWTSTHPAMPLCGVDGKESRCKIDVLTDYTVTIPNRGEYQSVDAHEELRQHYDTYTTTEVVGSDMVFTIINQWRCAPILITKDWEHYGGESGADPAAGHTSVTVTLQETVVNDNGYSSNPNSCYYLSLDDYLDNGTPVDGNHELKLTPDNNWSAVVFAPVDKRYSVQETKVDDQYPSDTMFRGVIYGESNGPYSEPLSASGDLYIVRNLPSDLNVYWVSGNGVSCTALGKDGDNWWGTNVYNINDHLDVNNGSASVLKLGSGQSRWVTERLPTQDGKYHLVGYGVGPNFGRVEVNQADSRVTQPSELNAGVTLDWFSSAGDGAAFKWVDNDIRYGTVPNGDKAAEFTSQGSMKGKAIYLVYEELQTIKVRKVWRDGGSSVDHSNDRVTFTLTPSHGGTIAPVDGGSFELTADDAVQNTEVTTWEKSFTVLGDSTTTYTVSEDPIPGGYSAVCQTTVEDGITVITITNIRGVELPSTGGPGTYLYTIGGTALLVVGLLYGLQLWRRREEAAE